VIFAKNNSEIKGNAVDIYLVGGAVRDTLLGFTPKDRDYVVVGSSPAEMLSLGFTQVGSDFPVFLHPESKDEYALARTERKSGKGYTGFTVDSSSSVTLEEDLSRRDLTINSIAMADSGAVIDPFHGQADLEHKILRHTSGAFREDPVRILRIARFLARFGAEWTVAPGTLQLLSEMIATGETDYLQPERIWKEFAKGLEESNTLAMVDFLQRMGMLELPAFSDYSAFRQPSSYAAFNYDAFNAEQDTSVKFALLFNRTWARVEAEQSKLPSFVREVAQAFSQFLKFEHAGQYAQRDAVNRLGIIEELDGLRQKDRFERILQALSIVAPASTAALSVDMTRLASFKPSSVIGECRDGATISRKIREARIALL